MKNIPECFETTPIVYAVGKNYQIMVPVNRETLMWIEVGGDCFYDDVNGILRSNCTTHRMTVPMEQLDAAGMYKICYRVVNERKPYYSDVSEIFEYSSAFYSVKEEGTRFFHIADAHNEVDKPVAAAKAFGEIDFLILNGDLPDHSGDTKNFTTIHRIAAEITNGEKPVVFSRGNHDMRGIYAENIADHTPTENGRSYYTFRLGSIWGMVLDCGEDKPDDHIEYGHTICCSDFRERQTKFIKNIILNSKKEYEEDGVEYRIIVMHDPFTEYLPQQVSERDMVTYKKWAKLLREYVKPNLMISGHVHQAYITNVGDALDNLGQSCPVVVASAPGTKISLAPRGVWESNIYVGVGFEVRNAKITIDFVGSDALTYRSDSISL
ncbi:MAG: metallophosphoesterase [Clostridia bacterium]|nr:metallophosphoesterase [Clostridia bacterium]